MSAPSMAGRVLLAAALAGGSALLPCPAAAEVERFALLVGSNAGDPGEEALRYAEDDAVRMHEVLQQLGGFRPENMVLLRGASAEAAHRALLGLDQRIRARRADARPNTMLFVYFSGHADATALHLGGTRLDLDELEALVQGSAAGFRILALDACRSGALTRVKGGRIGSPIAISLRDRLAGEGVAFLTATSASEDAQESDEIKGSFFTHHLVSGLLGAADADGDGQVVLEEAYEYAYDRTLRSSSRTLAGTQHPTFRYDLRGRGQIVLTRLVTERRAIAQFPPGRTYLVLRGGPEGPVVAEVGSHDRTRRLSLDAGRYFVRGRAATYLLEGAIELERDRERLVADAELHRIDYARLVRKGGTLPAVHGPVAGLIGRAALFGGPACAGAYAGYALETREVTIAPRLAVCGAAGDRSADRELAAEIRVSREWDTPWLTVGVGLAPGLAMLRDASLVDGAGIGRYRMVALLGSVATATIELPGSVYAVVEAGAATYVQRKVTYTYGAGASSRDPPRDIDTALDAALALRTGLGVGIRS